MKKEIINERKKRDAIQPVIGFSLALIMITLFGIFDVRKYGVEIETGTETTIFWIVRFLCIVLIPLFVFLLVKFVKQLFNNELFFKVSHEGIYVKISEKYIYNVKYEDIEKVTDFLRSQRPPQYNEDVISQQVAIKGIGGSAGSDFGDLGRRFDPNDPVVRKAVEISLSKGKFSTAMLQTYLGKGHGFVSGLAIWFEEIGVIGPQNGNKPRDLLITSLEEFDQLASQ